MRVSNSVLAVYRALLEEEVSEDVLFKTLASLNSEEDIYYLSRVIYSRGSEDLKRKTTIFLLRRGYANHIPHYELMNVRQSIGSYAGEEH